MLLCRAEEKKKGVDQSSRFEGRSHEGAEGPDSHLGDGLLETVEGVDHRHVPPLALRQRADHLTGVSLSAQLERGRETSRRRCFFTSLRWPSLKRARLVRTSCSHLTQKSCTVLAAFLATATERLASTEATFSSLSRRESKGCVSHRISARDEGNRAVLRKRTHRFHTVFPHLHGEHLQECNRSRQTHLTC